MLTLNLNMFVHRTSHKTARGRGEVANSHRPTVQCFIHNSWT